MFYRSFIQSLPVLMGYLPLGIAFGILFSKEFIEKKLNLTFNPLTTQIENHDYIVTILDLTACLLLMYLVLFKLKETQIGVPAAAQWDW